MSHVTYKDIMRIQPVAAATTPVKTPKSGPVTAPAAVSSRRHLLEFLAPGFVIALCMLGVTLIDYFFLMHQSLRLDESQSLWQASHSIHGLLHAVALDVHVPLYHLILHYWIFFFGDGVVAVRSLSLIFFLLTIPVVYAIGKQLLSRRWAIYLTVLFSFSPFLEWYSSEARMYTLLMLMSALSQYFFIKILKTGKGWLPFTLVALLGAYSHYFFMFTLAGEGIFFLVNRKQFKKGTFIRLLLVGLMVIAALSPWLYYFHSLGSGGSERPLLAKPSTVDFANAYSQFLFGFQNNHINTILLSSWPVVMLLSLLALARGKKATPDLGFIITMATIPVILAYVISLFITPFFLSRYMISCVAPLLIMLVWILSNYAKRAAVIFGTLLLIITSLSSIQQIASPSTPVKEDYRQAVSYVNSHAQPQDLFVLSAPFTLYPVEYYYHNAAQIETLPNWARIGGIPGFSKATFAQQVAAQNKNHRYIFLLLSQNQGYETTIKDYYQNHFQQLSRHTYSDDLTLYVYKVGYYTVPPLGPAAITALTK